MGGGSPSQSSLNATVITSHADFKLTNQTTRDLTLSAGLKYNERDNQTASTTYNFIDLGGKTRTSVNTPMSNRNTQMEVAGDMRIDPDRRLHVGYEVEDVKRWCNNSLANNTQGISAPVGWGPSSSCVQIPTNQESRLVAAYKQKVGDDVNFSANYVYAKRTADVNNFFYNPMQVLVEGYENVGYRAFFDASRTEQVFKAATNWQASEQLNLGVSGRYVDDAYTDSTLGVQKGSTWSANLDATYNFSDSTTLSGYLTMQSRSRDMLSGNYRYIVPAANPQFSNKLKDEDSTLGLTFTQKGLMAGKLELKTDLSYSQGVTGYTTQYPGFVPTAFAATCASTASLSCGSTPDLKNEMTQLKLSGTYKVDKASKIVVGYTYQQLVSSDYYYNFYQTGTTGTGNLPTNEQASNYSITAIAVGYVYNF
jgi:MtrB/PioB family decaheme-associated outer membrane protein